MSDYSDALRRIAPRLNACGWLRIREMILGGDDLGVGVDAEFPVGMGVVLPVAFVPFMRYGYSSFVGSWVMDPVSLRSAVVVLYSDAGVEMMGREGGEALLDLMDLTAGREFDGVGRKGLTEEVLALSGWGGASAEERRSLLGTILSEGGLPAVRSIDWVQRQLEAEIVDEAEVPPVLGMHLQWSRGAVDSSVLLEWGATSYSRSIEMLQQDRVVDVWDCLAAPGWSKEQWLDVWRRIDGAVAPEIQSLVEARLNEPALLPFD